MGDVVLVTYIKSTTIIIFMFENLDATLGAMKDYEHLFLNDLHDTDPRKRHNYLQILTSNGLHCPIIMCTYLSGNNKENLNVVWQISNSEILF